ncbi:MAG: hypothetical protein R3349_09260, partial [Geminicoccaceae bacterium]|nr:hypothetical protein [Geminicoccaceae bacterium]
MFSGPAIKFPSRFTLPWPKEPWLRNIMPRSLFGRSLLIVLLPILILQAVLAYVFYERHWDTITRWLANGLAGEVSLLVELLEEAPDRQGRTAVLDLARDHFGFSISLEPDGRLLDAVAISGIRSDSRLDETLRGTFAEALERPFVIDTRPVELPKRIAIYVQMDEGLLRILAERKRVESTTTTVFMGWMVG